MKKKIYMTPCVDMTELTGEIVMQNVSGSGSGIGGGGSSKNIEGDGDVYGDANAKGDWDLW